MTKLEEKIVISYEILEILRRNDQFLHKNHKNTFYNTKTSSKIRIFDFERPISCEKFSKIFIKIFRCPSLEAMEEMEIKLYSNGDSSVSTFSTSLFQFGDYELSYLHAQVKVCFLEHETCPTKVKIVNFNLKMVNFDRK